MRNSCFFIDNFPRIRRKCSWYKLMLGLGCLYTTTTPFLLFFVLTSIKAVSHKSFAVESSGSTVYLNRSLINSATPPALKEELTLTKLQPSMLISLKLLLFSLVSVIAITSMFECRSSSIKFLFLGRDLTFR